MLITVRWALAAELTREFGAYHTTRAGGLDFTTLKRLGGILEEDAEEEDDSREGPKRPSSGCALGASIRPRHASSRSRTLPAPRSASSLRQRGRRDAGRLGASFLCACHGPGIRSHLCPGDVSYSWSGCLSHPSLQEPCRDFSRWAGTLGLQERKWSDVRRENQRVRSS